MPTLVVGMCFVFSLHAHDKRGHGTHNIKGHGVLKPARNLLPWTVVSVINRDIQPDFAR